MSRIPTLASLLVGALTVGPGLARADGPAPAHVVAGEAAAYRPALRVDAGGTPLTPGLLLGARAEAVDAFPVDADGARLEPGLNVDLLARAGLSWSSARAFGPWALAAELEVDAFTGLVTDGPALAGEGLPNSGGHDTAVVREAAATVAYRGLVALRGGLMMSHWGLGLIANDGAHFWEPGSADFTDPRGGDRVLRGQLVFKSPGPSWALATVAVDSVVADDNLLAGDRATQIVGAAMLGDRDAKGGIYVVSRSQDAASGAHTAAFVVDLFGEGSLSLGGSTRLTLASELAAIWGRTALGATAELPEHDLLRLAGVVRATLDAGSLGGVLDLVYASGDRNLDDATQHAMTLDPNFSLGLIAFPYVMAGQTGRAPVTAANPNLQGAPPADLDRLPTRGAASNTLAIYPRLWVRPVAGLELYGGPLFIFADVAPVDPLRTRLAGGEPRNALDAAPGGYLGTELDLGARYRLIAWGSELTVGVEGAAFWPGGALDSPGATAIGSLLGGRAMLTYKL